MFMTVIKSLIQKNIKWLSLELVETFPVVIDRNSRQTKHKSHTRMLAYKEKNEPFRKSGKSPTAFSSLRQGTQLKYKANWLISGKKNKPQMERK